MIRYSQKREEPHTLLVRAVLINWRWSTGCHVESAELQFSRWCQSSLRLPAERGPIPLDMESLFPPIKGGKQICLIFVLECKNFNSRFPETFSFLHQICFQAPCIRTSKFNWNLRFPYWEVHILDMGRISFPQLHWPLSTWTMKA